MNRQPDVYTPGTQLVVGSHHISIIKYFSQGGFAQVYAVNVLSGPSSTLFPTACLKRVLVPNKQHLNTLRAEVDCMKLLKNNKHIVTYIDSHASKSTTNPGAYEVFMLMEYCERGGLIDFMNTRLQTRLSESEVLDIFSQTAQGVAAMHKLLPPLLHRDIKIENVLINSKGTFKLCDFGSVCGIIRPPKTQQEFEFVRDDVLGNTTAQYRAPEMIDLARGLPIDEKSDIWAMGVYLYKLCYYTTPFEKNGGDQAILKASYTFPHYPSYSSKIKNLISCLLRENPFQRPNICQTLEEVSRIQGVPCPIENFYVKRSLNASNTPNFATPPGKPSIEANAPRFNVPIKPSTMPNIPLVADISSHDFPSHYAPMTQSMAAQYSQGPARNANATLNNNGILTNPGIGVKTTFQKSMTIQDPFGPLYTSARQENKSAPSTTHNTGGKADTEMYALHDNRSQSTTRQFNTNAAESLNSDTKSSKSDSDYKSVLQRTTSRSSKTSRAESLASLASSAGSSSSSEEEETYIKTYATRSGSSKSNYNNRNSSTGSLNTNNAQLETMNTGGSISQRLGSRLKKIITGESFKSSSRQNTGNSMMNMTGRIGSGNGSMENIHKQTSPVRRTSSRKTTPNSTHELYSKNNDDDRFSRSKSSGGGRSGAFSNKRRSMIIPELDSPDKPDQEDVQAYYSNSRSSSPVKSHGKVSNETRSIRSRVNALFSEPSIHVNKTATGYGKYTETETMDKNLPTRAGSGNAEAIAKKKATSERNPSTIIRPMEDLPATKQDEMTELKKLVKNKQKKVPPKKPKKPAALVSQKSYRQEARSDDSRKESDNPLYDDVDEMTNNFSQRFPSVL
ncbi:hypothetical protein ACO0QE_001212 [Hanseniaspora vineae]